LNLFPLKKYFLPDDGKGFATALPFSDTVLCPAEIFALRVQQLFLYGCFNVGDPNQPALK
jgi:hypothetical protein